MSHFCLLFICIGRRLRSNWERFLIFRSPALWHNNLVYVSRMSQSYPIVVIVVSPRRPVKRKYNNICICLYRLDKGESVQYSYLQFAYRYWLWLWNRRPQIRQQKACVSDFPLFSIYIICDDTRFIFFSVTQEQTWSVARIHKLESRLTICFETYHLIVFFASTICFLLFFSFYWFGLAPASRWGWWAGRGNVGISYLLSV